MKAYSSLARFYDSFTHDAPYEAFADFYEEIFRTNGLQVKTILDLACGTGTLTHLLAARGYETLGVDSSPDMLSIAAQKAFDDCHCPPVFICQEMEELDLYGTVDAAVCSLDGINYLHPDQLPAAFNRVHLFLEPGGVFIFDIHTPRHLRRMNGAACVDETDDAFCVWCAEFDKGEAACHYGFDIFEKSGDTWSRSREEHTQYAHKPKTLMKMLKGVGFADTRLIKASKKLPSLTGRRVFITARKKGL